MTHVQNVHAFGELKGLCTGYGGEYNPGKQNLQVEALTTLWLNANQVMDDVIVAKAEYDIATNNREQAFAQLGKLSTRIFGILKAGGASPLLLKDAQTLVNKLRGTKGYRPAIPSQGSEPVTVKRRALGGRDYPNRVNLFASLLEMVMSEPTYKPNESYLSVAGLQGVLDNLRELNEKVVAAKVALREARRNRNTLLYVGEESLVSTALAVKQYVKAIYGYTSQQHTEVFRIGFTKPKVR
jgi:hypothetical protein